MAASVRWLLAAFLAVAVIGGWSALSWYRAPLIPPEPRLAAYVEQGASVSVVFTSRSEPASLEAAAPEGEVYQWPGQLLWQAREGRLRILEPSGQVRELSW